MSRSVLDGRTAVVTGAARGVGAALARELAGRGVRVALLGHERASLIEVAAELPTASLALEVDVTDAEALQAAARSVRSSLGRPSVVVANAGIAQAGLYSTVDPPEWQRVIEVNLVGSALTAHTFLPDLLDTRGYYLQIASLAAIGAVPMMSAYCASKSGAEAFAHALRAETAHRGTAVGVAYLNWVDTDMIRASDTAPALHAVRSMLPPLARRKGDPDAGLPARRRDREPEDGRLRPAVGTTRPDGTRAAASGHHAPGTPSFPARHRLSARGSDGAARTGRAGGPGTRRTMSRHRPPRPMDWPSNSPTLTDVSAGRLHRGGTLGGLLLLAIATSPACCSVRPFWRQPPRCPSSVPGTTRPPNSLRPLRVLGQITGVRCGGEGPLHIGVGACEIPA